MSTVGGQAGAKALPARDAEPGGIRRLLRTPSAWMPMGVVVVAFAVVFFRWFYVQHRHSLHAPEDWGHAYLIPLISGYLVWRRREQLARTPLGVFWPALPAFLLGIAGYFFSIVSIQNHMSQGLSVVLTLYGLVLLLLGPAAMRLLFLPIAFLGFGITISERIMIEITFQLQLIASRGSYVLLSVLGPVWGLFGSPFGVDIEGNTLTILHGSEMFPLNVAEACSGMRMVIAFYALAATFAVLGCREWWQRILLVLLAGPVAVLMNVVRVAVLGVLTIYNPSLASGDAHTLIGTVLLIPSLGLFLGIVWALQRAVRPSPESGGGAA